MTDNPANTPIDPDSRPTQRSLMDTLRALGDLNNPRIDAAFAAVPRQHFLPDAPADLVYTDSSVPVRYDKRGEATIAATMPSMVARLLAQSHLREGLNVLHIGTGTGYVAALISYIVSDHGNVTSLEIDREQSQIAQTALTSMRHGRVNVVHIDGAGGYAPRAAYDRIIANVGTWDIPATWVRQLKPRGLITVPIWLDGLQVTATFRLQDDGSLYAENPRPSAFVYMRGEEAMPPVQQRVGSTALNLIADDLERLDPAALHTLLSQDYDDANRLSSALAEHDYWYGFLPYIMLNEPAKDVFAVYSIDLGRQAYGMDGEGFAVFTPASACFVPYYGAGTTRCFAGADAFLEVDNQLAGWIKAGRPGIDRMRLRLIPKAHGIPVDLPGKVFVRRRHYLHVWLEPTDALDR